MATLPVGMQLVSALDDAELQTLSPIGCTTSEHVRRALLLPLESDDAVEMDIDVDVFRPSAMLETDAFEINAEDLLYTSSFQPDLGNAAEDIEQLLLYEDGALPSHHQHETAPGQGCQCRHFAIRADRVQAQRDGMAVSIAGKDHKRVLRHIIGSGNRLQGFGFQEQAAQWETSGQDSTNLLPKGEKHESLGLDTPTLHPSESVSRISSPLNTASFVALERKMTTPVSTTSRSTLHDDMSSFSPADEVEKKATSTCTSKPVIPKMNMLRGNFQVSAGKPTAVLPPPYFRGALDSPHKRRAHSKTIHSLTQSVSFSFSNESITNR